MGRTTFVEQLRHKERQALLRIRRATLLLQPVVPKEEEKVDTTPMQELI